MPIKLLERFSTAGVDQFARTLARDLAKRFPPAMESDEKPGARKRLAVALEELHARAARFKREKGLGLYRKAKLGNVFQWELKDLGFSPEFAERIAKDLVIRLAQKDKTQG